MSQQQQQQQRTPGFSEQGSTLIVALVMLLLITLIAVGSMQDTIMQERMTSNTESRTMAFEAAEAALRSGEDWLVNTVGTGYPGESRLNPATDWDNATPIVVDKVDFRAAENPAYHVGPPRCVPQVEQGCTVEVFPVTSRGVGGTAETVVMLRSGIGRLQ